MLQYSDITVPTAGATFEIHTPGTFIYYLNGSAGGADSTIKVRAGSSGQTLLLKPGQGARLEKSVSDWYITNYAGTSPILGQVLIGNGQFEDNRVTGSVEVIDGGKTRTLINVSYSAALGISAVNKAHLQLANPAGSGKNLIVSQIIVSVNAAAQVTIKGAVTLLATLVGAPPAKIIKAAATASVAQGRSEDNVAVIAGTGDFATFLAGAGIAVPYKFTEPVVIVPGYAITINVGINTIALFATIEYFEESI
jgi:hypothetical protein